MALLKSAKIGDLLYVPSYLLFPQRTGRWTRHNFSIARVTGLLRNKKTGAPIVEVEFYEAFRYRNGVPVQMKKFYVEDCMRYEGFDPFHIPREQWDAYINQARCRVVGGMLFNEYEADTMELFGIDPERIPLYKRKNEKRVAE